MLLNEFLKEHKLVEDLKVMLQKQGAFIAQQERTFQSQLAEQQKRIDALTSGLQKINAQLQVDQQSAKLAMSPP